MQTAETPPLLPRPAVFKHNAPVVVVAEDDPSVLDLLIRALGRTYTVYAAVNGAQAMEMIDRLPAPSAYVLDIMMPGADGLTIARKLRNDVHRKGVPVLLLTALTTPSDVIGGINAGARHYVTKPFKLADLFAKLEKAIGRRAVQ